MRKLIIFLIVIALVVVVADRGGDLVADRITADTLQSSQHLQQRPDVTIDGVPFLTQFATGHYQHVEIDAQNVRVGSTPLYLSTLHADFRTVTVSRSFDDFKAETATARGTVNYTGLSRLLKVRVRYAGNGRLSVTKKLPVIGKKTITFKARYANGVLRFGQGAVNGAGHLGSEVSSFLNRYFGIKTSLRKFPFDVRVRSVSVNATGLQFALAGRNLAYKN